MEFLGLLLWNLPSPWKQIPASLEAPFSTPLLTGFGTDLGNLIEAIAGCKARLEGLMDLEGYREMWGF